MARAFISYSRSDQLFVDRFLPLAQNLFSEHDFWYDQHITGGEDWWQRILDEINRADLFIYFISNESLESSYCQAEFREAMRLRKQILPVLVRRCTIDRAPDDIQAEIKRLNWVDMGKGFKDVTAYTRLQSAIRSAFNRITPKTETPLSATPVPEPEVTDNRDTQFRLAYIAGGFLVFIVIIAGVFGLWQGVFANNNPSDEPTEIVQVTTDTPTLTETLTPTPENIATLSATEIELSVQAEMQAIVEEVEATNTQIVRLTQIAGTAYAQQTVYAVETQNAQATATVDAYTDTPTPNTRLTAEARVTADAQSTIDVATETQAWIDSWTATPSNTPTSTSTPNATATLIAFRPQQNADWTAIEQDFESITMVLVPAGCFVIGSDDGGSDELNGNEVCFDEPFWMDKTEVTQTDFGRLEGIQANSSSFEGENRPVERITWFEARDFCALRGGRLPTEAEWEFAARGPDNLIYPWGNQFDGDNAVHFNNSGDETALVASRPAGVSWVGAMDMSGNVWEWTSSLYEAYPYNADDGREDDTGNSTDVRHVLRGGSFNSSSLSLRSADRYGRTPDGVFDSYGFRCARSYE